MMHTIFLVIYAIEIGVIAFFCGRMYEMKWGVYKNAYDELCADIEEHMKRMFAALGVPKKEADGSMRSPIQIKNQ